MTPEDAKELLLLHSFAHSDLDHPKMEGGFLGSLRPFIGLNEANFHDVMEALQALAPQFQRETTVDKEVMSALWDMCMLARNWGLHPDGMLRRNNLITLEEQAQLEAWIDAIEYAVTMLLGGGGVDDAFAGYIDRITSAGYVQDPLFTPD